MEDENDLYGDLEGAKLAAPAPEKKAPNLQQDDASPAQVKELQQQVHALRQENETLKRNIGTLFRTARAEIKRKDAKIEALEDELTKKNHASYSS